MAQRTVGRLVPAELLLAILENTNTDVFDKYLACDLMSCIFVENDLVFSLKWRNLEEMKLIGVNEFSTVRDRLVVTAGRVFNVFSRAKFEVHYPET